MPLFLYKSAIAVISLLPYTIGAAPDEGRAALAVRLAVAPIPLPAYSTLVFEANLVATARTATPAFPLRIAPMIDAAMSLRI